jgi:putative hydrolase of the HAD superfamily
MSAYQAVIFDLDGTLRESKPHFMDALHQTLLDMGLDVDPFKWRLTERWVHEYWAQSPEIIEDVRVYGKDQIWNRFLTRLMDKVGHPHASEEEVQAFGDHMREVFQPVSELTPGAREVLTTLQERGLTLGVLSNRDKPFGDELEKLDIAEFFDFTLAAGEVGVWKPRPEIFLAALDRAGAGADEAVYIGDNYYADIIGAREAGIDAILVDWRRVFTDVRGVRVEHLGDILPYILD